MTYFYRAGGGPWPPWPPLDPLLLIILNYRSISYCFVCLLRKNELLNVCQKSTAKQIILLLNHFRVVNGQIQHYQGLTVDLKSDNTVNSYRTSSTNSPILLSTAVLNVAPDRQFLQSFFSRGEPWPFLTIFLPFYRLCSVLIPLPRGLYFRIGSMMDLATSLTRQSRTSDLCKEGQNSKRRAKLFLGICWRSCFKVTVLNG